MNKLNELAGSNPAAPKKETKKTKAVKRLAFRLAVCMAIVLCIVLAHSTGDITTRLALILGAVDISAASYITGGFVQYIQHIQGDVQ